MLKAIMELNGKKTAYEAALSAAAQTMQLSLVNFLR
jgi:flagellin-like hook-associated protein FlgL